MDLRLTEEEQRLQETVRRLAQETLAPRAAQLDQSYAFPRDGLRSLAEIGLLGMLVPPPLGGGASSLAFAIAAEEIARACPSTALVFVTHAAACIGALVGGSDGFKGRLLSAMARGEKLAAIAATEANSGANPLAVEASARRDGDHYVVNGAKVFITAGSEADLYLTLVRTSPQPGPMSLSAIIVEKGSPGLSFGRVDRRMGLHGVSSCEVVYDNCRIPADNLLG